MNLRKCTLCPRKCLADRESNYGFCHAGWQPEVSSICAHKGEEPPISGVKGICNVFFSHCNLQCIFCQNYEISRATVDADKIFFRTLDEVVGFIAEMLPATENMLGLVNASHYVHLVAPLVESLHARGLTPTVVWNSNGYENVTTLRTIAPYIDIYLPDFKYMDADLARRYSNAVDYPAVAQQALREMLCQMGAALHCDEAGLAFRGIIVRHLVLPGQVDNSLRCLDWLAEAMGTNVTISLMAQYYPPEIPASGTGHSDVASHGQVPEAVSQEVRLSFQWPDQLWRPVTQQEYDAVTQHFFQLGFRNGFFQELTAKDAFRPDFSKIQAFSL